MNIFSKQTEEVIPDWKLEHPTWHYDHVAAGKKAAATNKLRYGDGLDGRPNFYKQIGRPGGLKSRGGGLTGQHERAVELGRRGGLASRRTKKQMEADRG